MFYTHYHKLPYSKQWEIKFKRRIKLNNNIYKICFVFWSLGTHDKFSRIWTPNLRKWLSSGGKVLCNSCITEMRSSVSKRLVRSSSNMVNWSLFDNCTSSVSLKMFSFLANLEKLLVIRSFVSGMSANFSRRHLSMVTVFWCIASLIRLKLWLCWIRTTKRVDSFSRKKIKDFFISKNVYHHSYFITAIT